MTLWKKKQDSSNFVLLDLRFVILIAEQYDKNKNNKQKKQAEINQITKQRNGEV